MKRTKWKRWFCLGAIGVVLTACMLPNTRSLIIGFGETQYVEWRLGLLHPHNERELWDAYGDAYMLGSHHYSLFKINGERVVRRWTRNPDGSLKPWVHPEHERIFISSLNGGAWSEDCTVMFRAGYPAEVAWRYNRWKIWMESGLSLLGGATVAWLGFVLVYALVIILVTLLLAWGKIGILSPDPGPPGSGHSTHIVNGGDAPHHPVIHDVAVSSPQTGWLVIWAMLFVAVVRDRRWIVRGIRTMSSRAPPCTKRRYPMRRAVATAACILLALLAPLAVRADAVSFATGEQLAMVQGTTVEGILSFGTLKFLPWALLDGSKFEAMPMWQFGGTPDSLVVGPLVGMSYDATGTTPYFGVEIRGKLKLGPGMFIFRLAERHTRERMLNRFANLGLEAGTKQFKLRLSYQPIRRNNLTTQRLALKATVPYKNVKIGLEVRSSLDEHQRKGAMLDLVVPLK